MANQKQSDKYDVDFHCLVIILIIM